jgi:hypothetical protein
MKKAIGIIVLILLILVVGYYLVQHNETKIGIQIIKTKTEKEVLSFLKNENYKVIEFNDKGYFQYKLTEEMLKNESTSKIWSFNKNAEDHVGKNIEEHYAVVTNHPLQEKYPDKRISLTILKSEGKVIGGVATVEPEYNIMFNLDGSAIN